MPNPTRQEIINAYTAVTTLARLAEEFTPVRVEEHKEINDLHLAVRAALPPKPRPTMAEVEWDDDKHFLAEAEHPEHGKVVMFNNLRITEDISSLVTEDGVTYMELIPYKDLTPTGRRYTLTEVQE